MDADDFVERTPSYTRAFGLQQGEEIRVHSLQCGWECRDGFFSIEWEKVFTEAEKCTLTFREERGVRKISIMWKCTEASYAVVLLHSQLHSTSASRTKDEDAIVLSLKTPPAFYEIPVNTEILRRRLSHLPFADHDHFAPFTSLALRVVCKSFSDLKRFRSCVVAEKLHRLYDDPYPTVRRQLFSVDAFRQLHDRFRFLNWVVSYQVLSLVYAALVDPKEALEQLMPPVLSLLAKKESPEFIARALHKLRDRLQEHASSAEYSQEFNLVRHLNAAVANLRAQNDLLLDRPDNPNTCYIHHVTITPTRVILSGPAPEKANRIIRQFEPKNHSCFLRVRFADETGYKHRVEREVDSEGFVRSRFGRFLLGEIDIVKRKYKFLAYSQSSLKEHCVWFVRPFKDSSKRTIDRSTLIKNIGTFNEKLRRWPARYAARISQAFTATDASVRIEAEEIELTEDVLTPDGKYCFTDGVGTISPDLVEEILEGLQESRPKNTLRNRPRAFQIRFLASKGVVAEDYGLKGRRVVVRRPSMIKFEDSGSGVLEIAQVFDGPGRYYLNRPFVMLLEGLGVPFETFQKYQNLAIEETHKATTSLGGLSGLLERHKLGYSFRLPSLLLNIHNNLRINSLDNDNFYQQILECVVNHVLRAIKTRARIPIPGAWTLVGVADEHDVLEANEIFACIEDQQQGIVRYLEGPVLISRSPVIHPGDVTVVNAIGNPAPGTPFAINNRANTVVFSVKGDRPVPTCLGGGDLDGDQYNLIPLNDLPEFHPKRLHEPASYEPLKQNLLDRECTMETDVANFVLEYINSDVLGLVATNWLVIADQTQCLPADESEEFNDDPVGIFSEACMKLAQLHSDAVDYPKTGTPVLAQTVPAPPRALPKPDWQAPETVRHLGDKYYESQTALGRLFRAVELPVPETARIQRHPNGRPKGRRVYSEHDTNTSYPSSPTLRAAVNNKLREYIQLTRPDGKDWEFIGRLYLAFVGELRSVMYSPTFRPLSEAEVITGTIAQRTSQDEKRKEVMNHMRVKSGILVGGAKRMLMGGEETPADTLLKRAWTAWEFSLTKEKEVGARSFGFLALHCMFEAMKEFSEQVPGGAREKWV